MYIIYKLLCLYVVDFCWCWLSGRSTWSNYLVWRSSWWAYSILYCEHHFYSL